MLHYAIVILGIRESKVLTCRENIHVIKREGEGGRERQQMHGKIMIQDQRAKAAVNWSMVGKGEEWLYRQKLIKTREIIMS